MNDTAFEELMESIRQAGEIQRGEKEPSRKTTVMVPDIKALRQRLSLTQSAFAHSIGVGEGTLRNWEQGRRRPDGAAITLLRLIDKNPQLIHEAESL